MPDPWEYPWFAAWDMAFHTVALAHLDPAFAKYQLLALCREWFQNPNGALPAYEWAFGDVNPPVHAWAALHVWDIDGRRDHDFLARLMPKLLMNFTWWVNRMDPEGDHLFAGGFLGLDNISVIDRSHLPPGGRLEQADGTSWMAFYSLTLLEIARVLAAKDDAWTDIEVKFIEHFVLIVDAMHSQGLWDEQDGFFYDVFHAADGRRRPDQGPVDRRACCRCSARSSWALTCSSSSGPSGSASRGSSAMTSCGVPDGGRGRVVPWPMATPSPSGSSRRERRAVSSPGCSTRTSSSRRTGSARCRSTTRHHPLSVELAGTVVSVDYEPAESRTGMFGGNSNWRGPVWMPVNYLVVRSLQRYARSLGAAARDRVPHRKRPTGRARDVRRRPPAAARVAVPQGRRRPPPLPRLGRPAAERPTVAGQHHVQRVLPRRQRRRARRQPPDRLDRAGGRPHLPAGPVRRATRRPWEL